MLIHPASARLPMHLYFSLYFSLCLRIPELRVPQPGILDTLDFGPRDPSGYAVTRPHSAAAPLPPPPLPGGPPRTALAKPKAELARFSRGIHRHYNVTLAAHRLVCRIAVPYTLQSLRVTVRRTPRPIAASVWPRPQRGAASTNSFPCCPPRHLEPSAPRVLQQTEHDMLPQHQQFSDEPFVTISLSRHDAREPSAPREL